MKKYIFVFVLIIRAIKRQNFTINANLFLIYKRVRACYNVEVELTITHTHIYLYSTS